VSAGNEQPFDRLAVFDRIGFVDRFRNLHNPRFVDHASELRQQFGRGFLDQS